MVTLWQLNIMAQYILKIIVRIKLIDLPDNIDGYWPVSHYCGIVVMVTIDENWVSDDRQGDGQGDGQGNGLSHSRGNGQGDGQGDSQGDGWGKGQGDGQDNGWGDCWGNIKASAKVIAKATVEVIAILDQGDG